MNCILLTGESEEVLWLIFTDCSLSGYNWDRSLKTLGKTLRVSWGACHFTPLHPYSQSCSNKKFSDWRAYYGKRWRGCERILWKLIWKMLSNFNIRPECLGLACVITLKASTFNNKEGCGSSMIKWKLKDQEQMTKNTSDKRRGNKIRWIICSEMLLLQSDARYQSLLHIRFSSLWR